MAVEPPGHAVAHTVGGVVPELLVIPRVIGAVPSTQSILRRPSNPPTVKLRPMMVCPLSIVPPGSGAEHVHRRAPGAETHIFPEGRIERATAELGPDWPAR